MTHASRRRRASLALAVAAAAVTALTGTVGAQSPAAPTGLKATYVSTGPIGVNPFLQLIEQGLTQGGTEFGVETHVTESADISALEDNLRAAVEDGNDLIVANSFDSVDAITKLSTEYPDQKWALVDTALDNPNVRGLVFREHEGAFLVGAIFGLLATGQYAGFPQSDVIGSVGAVDLPFIRRWYVGFEAGVKAVNPDARILESWGTGFNDPGGSKELALAQFAQGAKYIFAFAAAGNSGIFEAAKDQGFFTSGVDTDQRSIDPAHILESVVKRTDLGVHDAIRDLAAGSFTGGVVDYGLSQNGVGPAFIVLPDSPPVSSLPQAVQDQVRDLAAKIVSGEIVVPDYLAQPAASAAASSAP
jgi:basic membrane protein A and related proteins